MDVLFYILKRSAFKIIIIPLIISVHHAEQIFFPVVAFIAFADDAKSGYGNQIGIDLCSVVVVKSVDFFFHFDLFLYY